MTNVTIFGISYLIAWLSLFLAADKIQQRYEGIKPESSLQTKIFEFFLSVFWPFLLILAFQFGRLPHYKMREMAIANTVLCLIAFGVPLILLSIAF